jgi:anti-sigma regulatory factor (Ser/Thr protein kinase)
MGSKRGELLIESLTVPLALRFISGKYQGGEFPLPESGEIVIGRSSELDMVLVEDMVSRRHAKISVENGDIFLEDLGSTNGSFVNGEKITRTKLSEGDRILIGTSIIKVVASDGSASVRDAQAKMNAAASARPAAASTMTGSIAEVALPDLLQLFSASKKTGVLQISTPHDVGAIYLENGKVRFAVVNGDESVPPEKSFYRILVWDKGTFDLLPKVNREFPSEIESSIEGLLMEGMRQLDEISRLGDALPPLQSRISIASPLTKPLRDASPEELDVIQLALNHETLVNMMNHSGKPDPEVAETVVALLAKGYLTSE